MLIQAGVGRWLQKVVGDDPPRHSRVPNRGRQLNDLFCPRWRSPSRRRASSPRIPSSGADVRLILVVVPEVLVQDLVLVSRGRYVSHTDAGTTTAHEQDFLEELTPRSVTPGDECHPNSNNRSKNERAVVVA